MKGRGAFEVGFGIGFTTLDIGSGDQVGDMRPKIGGTETHFGERPRGGGDDSDLTRRNEGEKLLRTGEGDDIGDFLNFTAFHPAIFFQMNCGIGMGKEFTDGSEAGAAMREMNDIIGIEIVLECPASPHASDGGSGVNEDSIHVDEQAFAGDLGH